MTYQPPSFGRPYQQRPASGPPYGAAPAGFPPPVPPAKRKVWPWVLGGVALTALLGCVGAFTLLGAGAKMVGDAATEMDDNQKGRNAVVGKVGRPTRDGKFEFTVTGVKCGAEQVGPDGFGEKAQGQFCLVSMSVKNVGDTAEVFNDFSQLAHDAKGAEFQPDSGAGIWANGETSTFMESINPGNVVKGKLAFDVPAGTKLADVVLHESQYTAGVRVPLG
ncbi:DUF4352 domain-containing protein [Actinoplanes sp. HUAS TT8]|uniref:DUF4352 domain-containing protein n=1 Tax=Actinoplanes sp. HUAS TT8 TaxID=3447453 RepID=UPI003F528421